MHIDNIIFVTWKRGGGLWCLHWCSARISCANYSCCLSYHSHRWDDSWGVPRTRGLHRPDVSAAHTGAQCDVIGRSFRQLWAWRCRGGHSGSHDELINWSPSGAPSVHASFFWDGSTTCPDETAHLSSLTKWVQPPFTASSTAGARLWVTSKISSEIPPVFSTVFFFRNQSAAAVVGGGGDNGLSVRVRVLCVCVCVCF